MTDLLLPPIVEYDPDNAEQFKDHKLTFTQFRAYEKAELSRRGVPRLALFEAATVSDIIVSRSQWGARAPKRRTALGGPILGSTAHYEGPHMGDYPHDSCAAKVRGIQNYHMDHNGWDDVAYSSITCRHGFIFQCRWWDVRTAANGTNPGNASHYAHCVMIGVGDTFTGEAKRGLRTAFDLARAEGRAGREQKVHSDWFPTACPGQVTAFVRNGLVVNDSDIPILDPSPSIPTSPTNDNWEEELFNSMDTINLSNAQSSPVRGGLVDNLQGLLLAAQCPSGEKLVKSGTPYPDGVAGAGTKEALLWFQRMKGLTADAICGPATWKALVKH